MKRVIAVLVLMLLAEGCDNTSAELDKVKNKMKDPGSTQFRNVKHYPQKLSTCGEVNAKNSYGAYVGFRRFCMYSDSDVWIEGEDFGSNSHFLTEALEAHNEVLEEEIKRVKSGGEKSSDSEIKEMSDKRAFDKIHKFLCE